jgi:ribosomal protein S4E
MPIKQSRKIKDGAPCTVIGGTHKGKCGDVANMNINTSKTGHAILAVVQKNDERFKTLAKNMTTV